MRGIALVAFMALQLSMFTCGMNIHVHVIDAKGAHISQQNQPPDDGATLVDTTCQVHAAHVFLKGTAHAPDAPQAVDSQGFALASPGILSIPHRIDHPPRPSYG